MQKNSNHYERVVLLVAALLAAGGGGWLIWSCLGFEDSLARQDIPGKPLNWEVSIAGIDAAIAGASKDQSPWNPPVIKGKAVPLFKSVLLVLKNEQPDKLIDMYTEDDGPFRRPFTNRWLRENRMPYKTPNVAELDADDDGFTNLEEFLKQTDPNDAKSHPPITDHIFMIDRIEHKYLITLRSSGSPPYQVQVTTEDGKKKSKFVTPGAVDSTGKEDVKAKCFGEGDRFEAMKFTQKAVPDPKVGEKDVSELVVYDKVRKQEVVLVKDSDQNLAEFEAVIELRHKVIEKLTPRKGDSFSFPSQQDTTYKVIDIKEDNIVISPLKPDGTPEKEVVIKRG